MQTTDTRPWTLDELRRLPDDGNRYEVLRGELYVTPTPSERHQVIVARLNRALVPYVTQHGLGLVFHPRAVIEHRGSQLEPDQMVRTERDRPGDDWSSAPLPILVVEVLSATTRRRDLGPKREFYATLGIPEYWIVDGGSGSVIVARPGKPEEIVSDALRWHPNGAREPLVIPLDTIFG